jgi:hypothetical protein
MPEAVHASGVDAVRHLLRPDYVCDLVMDL